MRNIVTEKVRSIILASIHQADFENIEFSSNEEVRDMGNDLHGSKVFSIQLRLESNLMGQTLEVPLLVKTLLYENSSPWRQLDSRAFLNEINFYDKIVPVLQKFQRKLGMEEQHEMVDFWPTCIATKVDDDDKSGLLVVEDLKMNNYKMADIRLGLDFDHCKLVLKSLARFHAVSFALFEGDSEKIVEQFPWLKKMGKVKQEVNEKPRSRCASLGAESYKQTADILCKTESDKEKAAAIATFAQFGLAGPRKSKKIIEIIGHGDCWAGNILFQYDANTGSPVGVKFVDFKKTRISTRGEEISYFLYASAQREVLKERKRELEDVYYSEFCGFAKTLGAYNEDCGLSKENFLREMDRFQFYGSMIGQSRRSLPTNRLQFR